MGAWRRVLPAAAAPGGGRVAVAAAAAAARRAATRVAGGGGGGTAAAPPAPPAGPGGARQGGAPGAPPLPPPLPPRDVAPSPAEWLERAAAELRSPSPAAAEAALTRHTPEGIPIKALYTSADVSAERLAAEALPGVHPYTRGVHATMYTHRPWTVRQYSGFATAEESNAAYKAALGAGGKGLSVAFDLATHRGYDSDHERVSGDVGMAGVAIDSVEDMKRLFEGIPLDEVSVSMTMNGAVVPVLAFFIVAAEEAGVPASALRGTIQNDILKEFNVRNTFIYPPAPSLRLISDIMAYCSAEMPRFNTISVSGYHMLEAGAGPALELGLTLADGLEYLRCAKRAGLAIDAVAPRVSFFFGISMDFYGEVAKLRAARRLWANLVLQHFPEATDERSFKLRTHCQTSGYSLTAAEPWNNVVRTTVEAMAAVLGGTQSLHTNALDEAMALPTPFSSRVARNTQLILAEETGLTGAVDPWGGSYLMEALTDAVADKAAAVVEEVEAAGGMAVAVVDGWPKARIEEAAARKQARVDSGADVVVGVNKYVQEAAPSAPGATAEGGSGAAADDAGGRVSLLSIDASAICAAQCERLAAIKAARDDAAVAAALAAVTAAAAATPGADTGVATNVLAAAVAAARVRATLGEISSAIEAVYGRHQPASSVVRGAYSSAYDAASAAAGGGGGSDAHAAADDAEAAELRRVTTLVSDFAADAGRRPRLLVAKLGQDGHDRGAKVISAGFGDLGYDVDVSPLFATPAEVARAALEADVHAVGVSSQAAAHRTLVPELVTRLRSQPGTRDVAVLVGGVIPEEHYEELRAQGVDLVFGPGTRIPDAAEKVVRLLRERGGDHLR
ncbi:hypothetical protein I4F81_005206 [Pyropia yezoensis]|uniref:Uncharacterized protein n=1 Tax=Pyropia yezoensis TaxID=2788 RepID=A0ACC3BYI7_PYRYE|nr:hypothetical protein I4F81_005206 [Neopyropia yezoensis]